MDVSENSGTPKSSILIGFSIINHPFWGTPIFGNTQMVLFKGFSILQFCRGSVLQLGQKGVGKKHDEKTSDLAPWDL